VTTIYLPRDPKHESTRLMHFATVDKRDDRYEDYVRILKAKGNLKDWEVFAKAEKDIRPWETVVGDYNAMVNAGIDIALDLIIAAGSPTNYATATARLGVGSSTLAANATYTDLQTPIARAAMQSGSYPARSTHTVTFKSDFAGSTGDGAWQEWGVFNAASGATMLTRKVESLGTKSGGTWTLTTTMTFA
jgi:hypothetical protein